MVDYDERYGGITKKEPAAYSPRYGGITQREPGVTVRPPAASTGGVDDTYGPGQKHTPAAYRAIEAEYYEEPIERPASRIPAAKPVPRPTEEGDTMPIPLIGGALAGIGSAVGTVGGLAIRGLAASTATGAGTPGAASLAGQGTMFETGSGAATRALYGGTTRRRRRRRRLLSAQDKADIAFLHGQLGSGQLGKAAISAVLSRRMG